MSEAWGNHIAIVVDGILRHPNDSASIMSGLMLYKSLVKDHRISLIIDSGAKEQVQYWLLMNSLTDHTKEVYWEETDPHDEVARRLLQISRLKKDGPLAAIYESNTEVAKSLFEKGIPTFLFLHPKYMHPDHRPDNERAVTPWNALVKEIIRQNEARATDTRLDMF